MLLHGGMISTIDPAGPAAVIVMTAAVVGALEVIRRKLAVPLWRFYKWLRHEVRDEIARRKKIDDLLERELNPNGGSSMKDHSTKTATQITALAEGLAEIQGSQETIFQLFDNVVATKGVEHDELWDALHGLGVDRRHVKRRAGDS